MGGGGVSPGLARARNNQPPPPRGGGSLRNGLIPPQHIADRTHNCVLPPPPRPLPLVDATILVLWSTAPQQTCRWRQPGPAVKRLEVSGPAELVTGRTGPRIPTPSKPPTAGPAPGEGGLRRASTRHSVHPSIGDAEHLLFQFCRRPLLFSHLFQRFVVNGARAVPRGCV